MTRKLLRGYETAVAVVERRAITSGTRSLLAPLAGIALALGAGSMIIFTLLAQPSTREPQRERPTAPAAPRPSRRPLVLPQAPERALAPLLRAGRGGQDDAPALGTPVDGQVVPEPLPGPPSLQTPSGAQDILQRLASDDVREALAREAASARGEAETALARARSRTASAPRPAGQGDYTGVGEQQEPTRAASGVVIKVAPVDEVAAVEIAITDAVPDAGLPLLGGG